MRNEGLSETFRERLLGYQQDAAREQKTGKPAKTTARHHRASDRVYHRDSNIGIRS